MKKNIGSIFWFFVFVCILESFFILKIFTKDTKEYHSSNLTSSVAIQSLGTMEPSPITNKCGEINPDWNCPLIREP